MIRRLSAFVALFTLVSMISAACQAASPTGPSPVVALPPPVTVVPEPTAPVTTSAVHIWDFITRQPQSGTTMGFASMDSSVRPTVFIWAELRYDFGDVPFETATQEVCLTDTDGKFIAPSCHKWDLTKSVSYVAGYPMMYDMPNLRPITTTTKVVVYIVRGNVDFWSLPRDAGKDSPYVSESSIAGILLARAELDRVYHWQ